MNDACYLRWKSQVTGPFASAAIKTMIAEGRITKHHQISSDHATWIPLYESEIFLADCQDGQVSGRPASERSEEAVREVNGDLGDQSGPQVKGQLRLKKLPEEPLDVRWYYVQDGRTAGPISVPALRRLAESGVIARRCPVCREGEELWKDAEDAFPDFWVADLRYRQAAPRVKLPEHPQDCAYAGFWRRAFASLIDGIIVSITATVLSAIAGFLVGLQMGAAGFDVESIGASAWLLGTLVYAVFQWLYYALSEASSVQGTLGKRALGVFVTDMRGGRLSFGQASGRYFGKIISALLFGIGYIMAGITERKQALHDLMAGTLVLREVRGVR
jgi:uncharacterized RDD family membrane protein YckC